MSQGFKIVGLLAAVVSILFFLQYGTLHPCGALKKELKQLAMQTLTEKPAKNIWEQAGAGLGLALAGPMVDNMVDAFGPIQCTRGLIQIARGHNPFSDQLAPPDRTSLPEVTATLPSSHWKEDLKIVEGKWSRSKEGNIAWTLKVKNSHYQHRYKDVHIKATYWTADGEKILQTLEGHTAYSSLSPRESVSLGFTEVVASRPARAAIEIDGATEQ